LGQSQDSAFYDAVAIRNKEHLKARRAAAHGVLVQLGLLKSVPAAKERSKKQNDTCGIDNGLGAECTFDTKRTSPGKTSSMIAHEQLLNAVEVKRLGDAEVLAITKLPTRLERNHERVWHDKSDPHAFLRSTLFTTQQLRVFIVRLMFGVGQPVVALVHVPCTPKAKDSKESMQLLHSMTVDIKQSISDRVRHKIRHLSDLSVQAVSSCSS
jgi:hypothetical protein